MGHWRRYHLVRLLASTHNGFRCLEEDAKHYILEMVHGETACPSIASPVSIGEDPPFVQLFKQISILELMNSKSQSGAMEMRSSIQSYRLSFHS